MQATNTFPHPFGKYLLLRPLATGGMAEVFLAQMRGHAGFDKACVVKRVLRAHVANKQFMNMFLDEARVIARLSHPNVVQVFDMGQVDDDYFMAMEYVPGADLQVILDGLPAGERRMPVPVACRIVAQVAEGLDHAHRAVDGTGAPLGIVHRDVSPSNIIVSVDGVAKICDFGVAKFGAQVSKTEVGSLKGKIHYMSPEQVRGDKLDARSDSFSLGTLLYEATVGERPFEGAGPGEIALKILNDEPRPADMFVDNFPPELWAVIQCLLAKRPTDRFSSARELQVALDELLVAWKVRASSNEVAAYLEKAIPGIGAESRSTSALAARSVVTTPENRGLASATPSAQLAVGPTSPTLSARAFASSAELTFGDDQAVPSAIGLEYSGPTIAEESRGDRRDSSQSGSSAWIAIVSIVVLVGAGFYWLTRKADEDAPKPPVVTTQPTIAPPKIEPTPTKQVEPVVVVEKPAEKIEKPPEKPEKPTEAAVEPAPKAAAKHHSHSKPSEAHESSPQALPRLPTPPPPAEEADTSNE